jgi:hypothetical protein
MDLAFGTYRCPNHEPESLGIQEPISRSYFGQLIHPFLPRGKEAGGANQKVDRKDRAPTPRVPSLGK